MDGCCKGHGVLWFAATFEMGCFLNDEEDLSFASSPLLLCITCRRIKAKIVKLLTCPNAGFELPLLIHACRVCHVIEVFHSMYFCHVLSLSCLSDSMVVLSMYGKWLFVCYNIAEEQCYTHVKWKIVENTALKEVVVICHTGLTLLPGESVCSRRKQTQNFQCFAFFSFF